MSAPRVRLHTKSAAAMQIREGEWVVAFPGEREMFTDDGGVHGEGWSEAALVALPEPVDITPVCGCGTLAEFEGGVTLDVECGAIYDGTGRTFEADAAELQAARLLSAVALWRAVVAHRTPVPLATGRDREI